MRLHLNQISHVGKITRKNQSRKCPRHLVADDNIHEKRWIIVSSDVGAKLAAVGKLPSGYTWFCTSVRPYCPVLAYIRISRPLYALSFILYVLYIIQSTGVGARARAVGRAKQSMLRSLRPVDASRQGGEVFRKCETFLGLIQVR